MFAASVSLVTSVGVIILASYGELPWPLYTKFLFHFGSVISSEKQIPVGVSCVACCFLLLESTFQTG